MNLRTKAITGTSWTMVGQVIIQGTQLALLAILTRLLTPNDFGLMAMVTTVTALGLLFGDVGTASALVQRKELTDTLPSSVFWFNLGVGIILSGLTVLLSPLIAGLYQEPAIQPLLAVAGIGFTMIALGIVPRSLLQREIAFARIIRGEVIAVVGSALIGIGAAMLGAGVWSLVYQFLTVAGLNALMYSIGARWVPRFQFQMNDIQTIRSYSSNITGMRIIAHIAHNFDYMLIGRFIGTQALGYYMLAYRVMLYPAQNVSRIIGNITLSVYARLQDDTPRLQYAYRTVISAIAIIICPVSLGLIVVAEPFVAVVFGPEWFVVAPLLIILAPNSLLFAIFSSVVAIFESQGRPDIMLRINVFYMGGLMTAMTAGLTAGIFGVASGYVLATIPFVYITVQLALKLIDLSFRDIWFQIRGFFLSAVIMALITLAVRTTMFTSLEPVWDLGSSVALGVVLYITTNLIINRAQVQQTIAHFHPERVLTQFHFRTRKDVH